MNSADFCNSEKFEKEFQNLSSEMQKIAHRGMSDILYRTQYNKRSDVKIIRAKYMKDRARTNTELANQAREMLENPEIRKLLRKSSK